MARKVIKQRVELDGKNVEEQLERLGEVGERAFDQISKAAAKVNFERFAQSVSQFGSDLATVGRRVSLAFGLITTGAAAATGAALGLAKAGSDAAAEAGQQAQRLGLSVEAYGGLSHAAKQAGLSIEDFQTGLSAFNSKTAEELEKLGKAAGKTGAKLKKGFQPAVEVFDDIGVTVRRYGKNVQAIAAPTAKAADGFASLGIKLKDAGGQLRSTEDLLKDLADRIVAMPEGPRRLATAIQLLGKEAGPRLLPFLELGRRGIERYYDEASAAGTSFTAEQVQIGNEFKAALSSLGTSIKATRDQLGLLFAPAFTATADAFREIINQNRAAIIDFGRSAMLWGVGVLSDLVNALVGQDALVRRPWILTWRDAILAFGRDVKAVIETVVLPLFRAVRDAARLTADAINAVFGTEISAGQLLIGAALLKLLGVFSLVVSGAKLLFSTLRLIGSALIYVFGSGVLGAVGKFAGLFTRLVAAVGGFWGILIRGATVFLGMVASLLSWPVLLGAAVVAAGAAIFIFWDEIVAGAQMAIARIQEFFSAANLARVFEGLRQGAIEAGKLFVDVWVLTIEAVAAVFRGLGEIIAGFITGVVTQVATLASQLLPAWDQIGAAGSAVWERISGAASFAWETIAAGAAGIFTTVAGVFASGVEIVRSAFQPVADAIGAIWDGATAAIAAGADAIFNVIARATELAGDIEGAADLAASLVAPFQDASAQIDRIFAEIRNMAVRGFNAIKSEVGGIAQSIEQMIARILAALRQAAAAAAKLKVEASSSGGSSGRAPGLAGGGHIRGAGTATSDSIPAWLSNGEFVIKAAAVRKFGPQFFAMLNSMRLPKGFSMGGIVSGFERSMSSLMPVQRFAQGGPVLASAGGGASGRPINVTFEGETFSMVADESVAEKLQRFAIRKARNSTGRKPGWYGG